MRIQIPMTQDDCIRVEFFQFSQQGYQTCFLSQRARVFRFSTCVESAFITDTQAVPIMAFAMGTDFILRSAEMDNAVARHIVVVADVRKAAVTDVILAASFIIQVPPLTGGGTMENDQRDASHRLVVVTDLQSQGACHGRGYGDNHFEDDL